MPRLHLHLKVLVEPTITVDTAVASAKRVFAQAGIDVDVASRRTLHVPELENVNVTSSCQPPGPLTADQRKLFDLAGEVGPDGIAIFFVLATNKATNGCAQHPAGVSGAVITQACTRWTMAHEIGHLLGLSHVQGSNRLMSRSTRRITGGPPELDAAEIATISTSHLISNP
jgi:Metallo-peptidase family M12